MAHPRWIPSALLSLGLLATFVAVVAGYARHAILDTKQFGDRAVAAVRAEPVRDALSTAFADAAIQREPRLLSARPILVSTAGSVLASRASGGLISRAAGQLQRGFVTADEPSVVLDLADLSIVVRSYLTASQAAVATDLQRTTDRAELTTSIATRERTAGAIRVARNVSLVAMVAPLIALLAFVGAAWAAPDRRRVMVHLGLGLMATAATVATGYVVAKGLLIASAPASASAEVTSAIVDAFAGDLMLWALALGTAGTLIAAAGATLLGPLEASALPRAAWTRIAREPARPWLRTVRNLGLLIGGLAVVAQPSAAVVLVASVAGGYVALVGLVGLLGALVGNADAQTSQSRVRRTVPLVAVAVAIGTPFVASLAVAASDDPVARTERASDGLCNGSLVLCSRRLDEVVFPTAHNAMSNAPDGFLNANQGMTLTAQLDLGIRGLLIDALEGQRNPKGVVRTNLVGETRETVVAQIGEGGLAAAQRLAGRVAFGPIEGDTEVFLCHVLCELGATKASDAFREIRTWLERHPREVLIVFVQDDAKPADIVDAARDGGLADLAAAVDPAAPMPTLAHLIASGKRVVMIAEHKASAEPWYPAGFKLFQDTPYAFATTNQLRGNASCDRNRGTPSSPLLLVNHWIESYPPNPVNADTSNALNELVSRARRCQRVRGQVPTLLAVDFAERGDIVQAARSLNDAPSP